MYISILVRDEYTQREWMTEREIYRKREKRERDRVREKGD